MKISKVYTKTGDAGTTSLVGGQRINKDDCRLEAYGTVDELNSQLGLLVAVMPDGDEKVMVERMQCCLSDDLPGSRMLSFPVLDVKSMWVCWQCLHLPVPTMRYWLHALIVWK